MTASRVGESLYDSEAALRLVDAALTDFRLDDSACAPLHAPASAGDATPVGLLGLSRILARAYAEITGVLSNLRQSRAALEDAAVERLQHTHDKLREVSSATEVAATDILNRLETAIGLVDRIEAAGTPQQDEPIATLRNELFAMMGAMQFQDITAQQLNYASSVIVDMEHRLAQLARIFDPTAFGVNAAMPAIPTGHFDPAASTENAGIRQALADSIVADNRAGE